MIKIDYEKEYISLLENSEILKPPPQYIIDNNEKVAMLVWHKLKCPDKSSHYIKEHYETQDWKKILNQYKDNYEFWDKLFNQYRDKFSSVANLFLETNFSKDFPNIYKRFLTNDNIKGLFEASHEISFFHMLSLDEKEKIQYHKEYLIKYSNLHNEYIIEYQDDVEFLKKILSKKPYLYEKLNTHNKNNLDIISTAINEKYIFLNLHTEKQLLFFEKFLDLHLNNLKKKDLASLNEEMKDIIFEKRIDLLETFSQHNFEDFKSRINKIVIENPDIALKTFNALTLNKSVLEIGVNSKEIDGLRNILSDFIENFMIIRPNEYENKCLNLISLFEDLQNNLNQNFLYNLYLDYFRDNRKGRNSMNIDMFNKVCMKVIELYDNNSISAEKGSVIIKSTMRFLSVENLKALKIPNENSLPYIKAILIKTKLSNELQENSTVKKINKI